MAEIRILVISDLHAISNKNEDDDSHLLFENNESEWGNALISYIEELDHKIDVLICAGDIANKANKESFQNGWNFINRIQTKFNIPDLLCVPGNHDHQSRAAEFSPKHELQFCSPIFPFSCVEKNTHFWAWNWAYFESSTFNSVLLNTSAYHGHNDEYKHGRVAIEVVDQIESYIKSDKFVEKKFNIMLCHHHPEKMDYVDNTYDHESMEGGSYLLSSLNNADVGPWLIIHGHKHFASVSYANSSGSIPHTIFSAGSVSAKIYPMIKDRTSNQFYFIDVNLTATEESGRLTGTFSTHEWNIQKGWGTSLSDNLPDQGGFGGTITNKEVANSIEDLLSQSGPFLEDVDLIPIHKMTKNMTPSDFKRLIQRLEKSGLTVNVERNKIMEVGRSNE